MEPEILRLHLASSLYCIPLEEPGPFDFPAETDSDSGEEKVFCFELDVVQRTVFEPDKNKLLGNVVFGGSSTGAGEKKTGIPKGDYLFAQKRKILNKDEIISLAAEIQQEGLWQRLVPGEKLYLRYLYEDGSRVTQLFRPYEESV